MLSIIILAIGIAASKHLRVRRIFSRISRIFSRMFCQQTFSHKDHESLIWCDLQKMTLGAIFWSQNNAGNHFCPDFQGLCPDFWQIKTFGGALGTPAPPASYTTDNSSCTVVTIDLVIFWAHSRKNVPVCKPKFFCKRDFWIESGCVLIVQVKLFIAYCAKFSDIFSFMWLSGIWRAPDQSLQRRLRGFWGRFLEVQTIM